MEFMEISQKRESFSFQLPPWVFIEVNYYRLYKEFPAFGNAG